MIVQARGTGAGAAAHVLRAGGKVTGELPVVDGVAATVPAAALAALASTPGMIVSPDRPVQVQQAAPTGTPSSVYRDVVGATDLHRQGHRGAGVNVALIDTGVSNVADLTGRIIRSATS